MTYEIVLGNSKKTKVGICLDSPSPSGIPASVLAGVGDKKKRYKAYLDKCFEGGNKTHPRLLNFLANIHRLGKEYGDVSIFAFAGGNRKLATMQMESVKEFVETNRDTLDIMLPYLFADLALNNYQDKPVNVNIPDDLKTQLDRQLLDQDIVIDDDLSVQNKLPPKLTEDDMRQINALIELDQNNASTISSSEQQPLTEGL